jgi:hypothetical protein
MPVDDRTGEQHGRIVYVIVHREVSRRVVSPLDVRPCRLSRRCRFSAALGGASCCSDNNRARNDYRKQLFSCFTPYKINNRPRKALGYQTPYKVFSP